MSHDDMEMRWDLLPHSRWVERLMSYVNEPWWHGNEMRSTATLPNDTNPASPPEPLKGFSGASYRLGNNQGWNHAKLASAGSEWPKRLPSMSKQDQGPHLPTTTLQSGGVLRARFPHYSLRRMLVSLQVGMFTRSSFLLLEVGPSSFEGSTQPTEL